MKVWELASGELLQTLSGHEDGVGAVTVSRDGKWVVSGSNDRTVKVWELITGRLQATYAGDNAFYCCAVSSDVIVAGDSRGLIHYLRLIDAGE